MPQQDTLTLLMRASVPISLLFFMVIIAMLALLVVPAALTKHVYPIHWLRSWVLGKAWHYWQLSLEGPLFKMIGACGKRLGRGLLSSSCRTPKAFKAKVLSINEIDVAWTPQIPANPFHQEHYVISYCQVDAEGDKGGQWMERELHDEDYFKKDKEKPKEIGKAARRRLHIGELPSKTSFCVRVCAAGPGGRSKWSPEIITTTFAEPDKKSMGFTGPLAKGSPTDVHEYKWWQSKHEVGMTVAIPDDWKGKDVSVKVLHRGEHTEFTMQHERGMMLSGHLGGKIKTDEVDWTIEKGQGDRKEIQVTLRKEKLMQLWECFLDGHTRIDPALIQLIHEGNSLNELGTADLWE